MAPKRSPHTIKLIQVNILFQKDFTKMDGTPPAPEGKKRVITEEVVTTTTTKRTIVEDPEVAGPSQQGIYIMIIIPGFRKLRLVCPVPGPKVFFVTIMCAMMN